MTADRSYDRLRLATAELGERYGLDSRARDQLIELIRAVTEHAHPPTSVRAPLEVLNQHVADSLVALEQPALQRFQSAVDIGSGAGFPGLALAVARPQARFVLLESNARKCQFIRAAADRAGIGNVAVVQARAEGWPDGLARFDVATARALASLEVVAEYAAPLLKVGGVLVAWRGRRDQAAEAVADRAAAVLGLDRHEVFRVSPFPGAADRHLHLMSKVMDTPGRFPRRPGTALKRPLGGGRTGGPGRPGRDHASDRARR